MALADISGRKFWYRDFPALTSEISPTFIEMLHPQRINSMRLFLMPSILVVLLFSVLSAPTMAVTIHRSSAISGRLLMKTRTDSFYHRGSAQRPVHKP